MYDIWDDLECDICASEKRTGWIAKNHKCTSKIKVITAHNLQVVGAIPTLATKERTMNKNKQLIIWLTKEEKQIIKTRSAYMGITMTDWIRTAISDRLDKEKHLGWPDILPQQKD
jgi:hypothetical protein